MTATPEPEYIRRFLLKMEAAEHKLLYDNSRWDKPAKLFLLYDGRDAATVQHYRPLAYALGAPYRQGYLAAQSAMPSVALRGNAAAKVRGLAASMGRGGTLAEFVFRTPGFLGLAFLFEAWVSTPVGEDEVERDRQRMKQGISLADVPWGRETRTVNAVDIAGTSYCLLRIRGEQAKVEDAIGLGPTDDALRTIVSIAAGQPVADDPRLDAVPEWVRKFT